MCRILGLDWFNLYALFPQACWLVLNTVSHWIGLQGFYIISYMDTEVKVSSTLEGVYCEFVYIPLA